MRKEKRNLEKRIRGGEKKRRRRRKTKGEGGEGKGR